MVLWRAPTRRMRRWEFDHLDRTEPAVVPEGTTVPGGPPGDRVEAVDHTEGCGYVVILAERQVHVMKVGPRAAHRLDLGRSPIEGAATCLTCPSRPRRGRLLPPGERPPTVLPRPRLRRFDPSRGPIALRELTCCISTTDVALDYLTVATFCG